MQIRVAAWQREFTHWRSFSLAPMEEHRNTVICFAFRDMKKRGGRQHCCQEVKIFPRISETSVPEGLRENAAC